MTTSTGEAADGAANQTDLEELREFHTRTVLMIGRALDVGTPEGSERFGRLMSGEGAAVAWATGDMAQVFDHVLDERDHLRARLENAERRLRDGGATYAAAIVAGTA